MIPPVGLHLGELNLSGAGGALVADEVGRDDRRVIILSAGVGAGHDGAARAWAERLGRVGYDVQIHDLLGVLRRRRRPRVAAAYEAVLHRAPWVYQALFAVATRPFGVVVARGLMGGALPKVAGLLGVRPHRRWACRWADRLAGRWGTVLRRRRDDAPAEPPAAVLCTYPLAGHVLGELRRQGRLQAPVLTFLTDFSVHRLCVAPGVDAHLAVHRLSAAQARACGGVPALVCGPVVGRRFRSSDDHPRQSDARQVDRLRDRFGLPHGVRLALLVAGSWGVGEVETTAAEIAATGVAVPVVVCGHNERLRARVVAAGGSVALGWITDMPALMRGVDVLVENAGGLTSLEAMAVGLPVASYRPIAGHGRTNAEALAAAGVSSYIRDPAELGTELSDLIAGDRGRLQRDRGLALFAGDPVEVFRAAVRAAPEPGPEQAVIRTLPRLVPASAARPTAVRIGGWARSVVILALFALAATIGGNSSTEFAVAHGLRAVRPSGAEQTSYLLVRPGPTTDLSGATERLLLETSAAVAVDRGYAAQHPQTVRKLAADGVPILVTEPVRGPVFDEVHAIRADAASISQLTGSRPTLFVPKRRIDVIDYGAAASLHDRVVQPRIRVEEDGPIELAGSQVVLIDCSRRTDCHLGAMLARVQSEAEQSGVPLGSIAALADEPGH